MPVGAVCAGVTSASVLWQVGVDRDELDDADVDDSGDADVGDKPSVYPGRAESVGGVSIASTGAWTMPMLSLPVAPSSRTPHSRWLWRQDAFAAWVSLVEYNALALCRDIHSRLLPIRNKLHQRMLAAKLDARPLPPVRRCSLRVCARGRAS